MARIHKINEIKIDWQNLHPACGIDTDPVRNIDGETVANVPNGKLKPHAQQDFINQLNQILPSWGYSVQVEGDLLSIVHDASGAYLRALLSAFVRYVDHSSHKPFDELTRLLSDGVYISINDILKHLRPAPSEVKPLAVPTDSAKALANALTEVLTPLGYQVLHYPMLRKISIYGDPNKPHAFDSLSFAYINGAVDGVRAEGVILKHPAVHALNGIEGPISVDALVSKLINALSPMPNEVERFWIVCNDVRNLNASYRHATEESATKEAARLQAKIGGQFLIFQCVGAVNQSGVATVVDPLPF